MQCFNDGRRRWGGAGSSLWEVRGEAKVGELHYVYGKKIPGGFLARRACEECGQAKE